MRVVGAGHWSSLHHTYQYCTGLYIYSSLYGTMYSATVQQRRKYEAGSSYLPLACCPVRPQNGRAQVITTGTSAKRVRFRRMEGLRCSGLWRTGYKYVRKQSINCLVNRTDEWMFAPLAFEKHCLLTGQEQACSRIRRLVGCSFVITMPKMA